MPSVYRFLPVGAKYGKWTVIGNASYVDAMGRGRTRCTVRCDCGTVSEIFRQDLVSGLRRECSACGMAGRTRKERPFSRFLGSRFGKWTVTGSYRRPNESGRSVIVCLLRCDCGATGEVHRRTLTRGESRSCRTCAKTARAEKASPSNLPIGAQFGEWTVTGNSVRVSPNGKRRATCSVQCSCGATDTILRQSLVGKSSRSCKKCSNAARAEGQRKRYIVEDDALRQCWRRRFHAIIQRCLTDPHKRYGLRGISFFAPWRGNFALFMEHIKTLPGWDDSSLELDRIDNDYGYYPGNLRMATRREQLRNTSQNRWVEYNGMRLCATDFATTYCDQLSPGYVLYLLRNGRDPRFIVAKSKSRLMEAA